MFEEKTISQLVNEAYQNAVDKGWHEKETEFGTFLALVYSEVTEAIDAETDEHTVEELADVAIRLFDLAGLYSLDLEPAYWHLVDENFNEWNDFKQIHATVRTNGKPLPLFYILCSDINRYISETLESYRDASDEGKKENITIGMAKAMRATIVAAQTFNLDIEEAIHQKMKKNKKRPYKHGGKKF